jgi:hypothetical protein
MYSGRSTRALPRVGFPIRTSRDQRLVSTSPGLFAAAHVLHRLLAPRHPPCALHILIVKNTVYCCYGVFKVRADRVRRERPKGAVSQNSTAWLTFRSRSTLLPGEPGTKARRLRSLSSVFPRKEVIQPQLPLRLPCYDFTPVTNPTFDGSLPCGLGHRLRVLPASVV